MSDAVIIAPYDPEWPAIFQAIGRELRAALGDGALRIDHIGSTSIPGMSAKPVVDIQISVIGLEPAAAYEAALARCGFDWRADNPDLTKRYFRERAGARRTHIHVRRAGSFSEQAALLFRDYLRADPDDAAAYSELKRRLAAEHRDRREAYLDAKTPFIWQVMRRAAEWSQRTGWMPGPSDC